MDEKSQSAKLVECSKSRKEWSETLHQTYFPGPFGVGEKRDLGNEVEISLAKSALHIVLSSSYVVCHTQSRKFLKVIHPSCRPASVKDFLSFANWELCICKKKNRPACSIQLLCGREFILCNDTCVFWLVNRVMWWWYRCSVLQKMAS